MSETAPEAPAPKAGGGKAPAKEGKLGFWSKKAGPMPLWGWTALVMAVVIAVMYYRNQHSSSSGNNPGAVTADNTTDASLIPQFVNQDYTTVTPPAAPTPTPTPAPPPTVNPGGPFREVAAGHLSLAQVAKARHTTVAHLISETESGAGTGGHLTKANLAKFKRYVKHGTNKPMPKGLVYYVSSGPAQGGGS